MGCFTLSHMRSCLYIVQIVIFIGLFSNEPEKASNLSKEVCGVIDIQVWKCDCECICHAIKSSLFSYFRSLGQEDPLEKEMASHSSILAWRIPWTGSLADYSPWGRKESDMTERLTHTFSCLILGSRLKCWKMPLK